MHGGSSIAAMGELLLLLLVVWALALPFFLSTLFAAERGRTALWPLAGTIAGAFAFVYTRRATADLDTIPAALLPLAAATGVSLGFTAVTRRLRGIAGGRRWRGHRLPEGTPCTLAVVDHVLHLDAPGAPLPITGALEISHRGTVVDLAWRGPGGTIVTATFLPHPDDEPDTDPRLRAERIAARVRQLLGHALR
jgi:hypothetical protein